MRRRIWAIALLGSLSLAATIIVAIAAGHDDPKPSRGPKVAVGTAAPDIALKTLDQHDFRLSALRGKPVILTFGASWCHPCREEYPRLERIRMRTPEIKIVGVLEQDSPGIMQRFMKEVGATWPVVDNRDEVAAARYGVDGLPVTLFIDRTGNVIARITGLIGERELARRVKSLVAVPTATTSVA